MSIGAARALPQGSAAEVQAYYCAVTDLVRDYVEAGFGVRVPGLTTDEFLVSAAVGGALGAERRRGLGEFLAECDRVKFGRLPTTATDRERASAAAERFVRDSAPERAS